MPNTPKAIKVSAKENPAFSRLAIGLFWGNIFFTTQLLLSRLLASAYKLKARFSRIECQQHITKIAGVTYFFSYISLVMPQFQFQAAIGWANSGVNYTDSKQVSRCFRWNGMSLGTVFWLALKEPRKLAGGKPQAPPPEWHPFGIRPGGAAEGLRTSLSSVLSGRKPRADATGGGDRRAVLPPANFRSPFWTFPRTFPNSLIQATENSGEQKSIDILYGDYSYSAIANHFTAMANKTQQVAVLPLRCTTY
jgi:hypothetical protein